MNVTKDTGRTIWCCVLLSVVTLVTYQPLISHDFVNYDDPIYVTLNAHVMNGLSARNAVWAFSTTFGGNWHPLTWLSHMLDVQLFGLTPGWHHLTSLLLHAASAALLFLLFKQLTGAVWRSASVAALFALHPLHVESVAWVSERKDVLSGFFFILTLLAYAKLQSLKSEVQTQEAGASNQEPETGTRNEASSATEHTPRNKHRAPRYYMLALCFFALGLMSKPMLVTLPFVLLLLDFWPLRRFQCSTPGSQLSTLGRLALEKLPFFALSAISCVVTFIAQHETGAVRPLALLSVTQRLSNAVVACATYLEKTFWPAGLTVFYPLRDNLPAGIALLAGAIVLGLTVWAVGSARSRPYLAVGWFWFLGMLVPVIGLVQVGMQEEADRYTYLPLVGVFLMIVWEVSERWSARRGAGVVMATSAGGVLLACAVLTNVQLGYWHDSERLFRHALDVTRDNWLAHQSLGNVLLAQDKLDEAISHYQAAVALQPRPEIRYRLGETLSQRGRYEEAVEQFSELIRFRPDNVPALVQLGIARARQGKTEEAAQAFVEALRIDPDDAGAHNSLGNLFAQQGKHEEAVRQFEIAVRLKPDHAGAHNNLAISCKKLGRIGEAIAHYREAIRLQPDSLEALNNLAWMLAAHPDARFRSGAEAVQLATRACELTKYQNPVPLATLAAAYAETDHFREAVSLAEQAQDLARVSQGPLAARLSAMLDTFRAGRAYHGD